MTTMEELYRAAIAYYHNASDELQQLAQDFFRSMDLNNDRQISFDELGEFFRHMGYHLTRSVFNSLDRNGDGVLDFWEVLTLYYIMKTRVHCIECSVCLMGQYFTCVECFDSSGDTYDLCVGCYSERRYQHRHHSFLDSYVLLRSMRGLSVRGVNQAIVNQPVPPRGNRPWSQFDTALKALEVTLKAANFFASNCTIM